MNTARRARSGREGFTLVELLMVIAIVGILVQITAPSLGGVLRTWRSKQAADQIAADFMYARSLALRSGGRVAVVFDSDRQYRIEDGTAPDVILRKSVDLAREYGTVRLIRPGGVSEIVFNGRGMATSGAGAFVVESTSDGRTRQDTLWLSVLGMVRREG